MKWIRNISIRWKIMVPIFILALVLFVACVQGNLATQMIMDGTIEVANKYEQSITELETLFSDPSALQDIEEIKRLYAEMNEKIERKWRR